MSQTDTETVAHLVAKAFTDGAADLEQAVRQALRSVVGTYGLAVMDAEHPDRIVVARNGSPVVLGIGEKEMFVASDVAALVGHTRQVVYLDDGELATITADGYRTYTIDDRSTAKSPSTIDWDVVGAEIGDHAHYLIKEIAEQPRTIARAFSGRIDERFDTAQLGGLNLTVREAREIRRVKILGCGSAYYAGDLGAQLIEELARIPATLEAASEFRYRNPVVEPDTLYIAVSQSGETIDTLAAVQELQRKGGRVIGHRQRRRLHDRPPGRRRHLRPRGPGDVGGGHEVVHQHGDGVRAARAVPRAASATSPRPRASASSRACSGCPSRSRRSSTSPTRSPTSPS